MKKRRWTVVFVPHGSEPSRIVEVSYGLIKTAVGGLALGLAAALLVGYATMARTADLSRTASLQEENARLVQAIGELHGRLSTLSDTLTRISQRDARIRVLANLEPIDPQVQAAGIGGPTLAPRPALPSDGPAVRRSRGDPGRPERAHPPGQPPGFVVRGGQGQPGQPLAAPGRHAVDHADARLAHQRVLVHARAPDPAHRPAARGHRRDRPDWGARSRPPPPASSRTRAGNRDTATPSRSTTGTGS